MDNKYQEEILEKARKIANETIAPLAKSIDINEGIPREVIKVMADNGLLGAIFPKEYGGLGLDPLNYGYLTEIIGKACCSCRALLTVHTSLVGETIIKRGTQYHKEKYLPRMANGSLIASFALSEPNVGSDANSIQTTYEKKGNKFIINGEKKWISFGAIADLFLVIANDKGTKSAFLVERNFGGIETAQIKGLLASRGAYVASVKFDNVEVPEENLIGRIGAGFSFIANTALFYGRYSIAWGGLAIAQAALENMISYSKEREQFGDKIGKYQLIQEMIANAVTNVHASRIMCERIGNIRINNLENEVMETNIAKYFTSRVVKNVTNDAVQVLGGNGCCNEYPVERLFREAKIMEIIEGSSQMQQLMIANYGLKKVRLHSKN